MTPFDIIKAITFTKEELFDDPQTKNDYVTFIINRGLSYFPDTLFCTNEMNQYHNIDVEQQFKFLMNSCSKRKRYSPWAKKTASIDDIDAICSFFGYSRRLAKTVINTITEEQLQTIREKFNKGGK